MEPTQEYEDDLSCTFCGPGTWAVWEIVTVEDDGVVFTCDKHHLDMEDAQIIKLKRMKGEKTWRKFDEPKELTFEKYLDNLDFDDMNDYE
jgi:hypothetical protein